MTNTTDVDSLLYGDDASTDQKTFDAADDESLGGVAASGIGGSESTSDTTSEEEGVSVADLNGGVDSYQINDGSGATGAVTAKSVSADFQDSVVFGSEGPRSISVTSDANNAFTSGAVLLSAPTSIVASPIVESVRAISATPALALTSDAPSQTIGNSAGVEVSGPSAQSIVFAGTTGTLQLDDAVAFTGQVSGLSGSDALDLVDIKFGANTTATYLGTTTGGTLTVTDGSETANIALVGDYLSSTWDVSGDGNGGTVVVDPVANTNWQELDVGAGGYLTGMDIAADDSMVVRTDTYGAYIWNGTKWQQLVTSESMPAAWAAANSSTTGTGVYEIQIASSNSNILYMEYDGYVFKSTNKGTTWTETSFAPVTENTGDPYRYDGQKMAIDPDNPNIVNAGTPQNGMFVTTDGGTTWQSVSGVPIGQSDGNGNYPGITGIEFDPALGVGGGKTNTIFAASYGNGVYESTNGGASWTSIGGPSTVAYATVSSTGVYYVVGNVNAGGAAPDSLWSYQNGVWTELLLDTSGNGIGTVAVDPFNPNEIVTQTSGGNLDVSYDGGLTWSGTNWYNHFSSTDIPWLDNSGNYMSVGATLFDQVTPNELWTSDGVGVWNTTVPTSGFQWNTQVTWNDQSAGIEQLVANDILAIPGGDPIVASWDRAFFTIANPNAYPTNYGPVNGNFAAGWSLNYASSDPSFIVGIADWWGNDEESGYSTNDGQTWTPFPTELQNVMGGTIAASTPENIIWAPADRTNPYYTLDGGQTWNPITLPGVTNWNNFDWAYYLDVETVTADRVLPNTFYLYYGGIGVFESTNGGVSWTQVHGPLSAGDTSNYEIQSVPGQAGDLFFTAGPQGGSQPDTLGFYHSTDQGVTWTAVPNVTSVDCFGFGAPAPGQSYPAIYIVGAVNGVFGIWQSNNEGQSWVQIGTNPENSLDYIKTISGDPNIYGQVYVGFGGSGYAYLSATPTGPTVTGVAASPSTGIEVPGNTLTLTLTMSEAVTVTGTPTLTLNDGGTATYSGGSGTDALTFSYTVGHSSVSALAIVQVNQPNGARVTDSHGNAADLLGALTSFPGLQIDPPATHATLLTLTESPASGTVAVGQSVTLALDFSEPVTIAGGTPTLTLNDGGTATYTGGSGTSTLTFSYTVSAGQNTSALAATAVNLNAATITDATSHAVDLSLSGLNQSGPQISAGTLPAPDVTSVIATGNGITSGSGTVATGQIVTLNVDMSQAVVVAGGTPTLTLNDGGIATYTGGSGTNALAFSYTVAAGQSTTALGVTAVSLNGATITSLPTTITAGSGGSLTDGSGHVWSFGANGAAGGYVILRDGIQYAGGSGLTLSLDETGVIWAENSQNNWYMVSGTGWTQESTGPTTASLQAANLTGAATTLTGPLQVNTTITTPLISSLVESPSSGDLSVGKTVTLTINFSEAVMVAGGTPTLTLNDGGTATYVGGSGTDALTFSYTVSSSDSDVSALAGTQVNEPNGATITDSSGNAASLSLSGVTQSGPPIDPPTIPTVSSLVEAPASGDLNAGKIVTLTINFSEAVMVAGGTPTLTLNDGGTATYVGGSGSNTLVFSYAIGTSQNTSGLAATAVNLNSATITDSGGNAANVSLSGLTQSGPQIDTTTPTVSSVVETPSRGDLNAGKNVTLTVNLSEAVTVTGGTPTLALNDGGIATYVSGSGSSALVFSYTVGAGQSTSGLAATAIDLNSATIADGAGNAANLALSGLTQSGPQIDTTTPTVTSVVASGSGISSGSGDLNAGKTVTLTVNLSEAITVADGTPTLTLNDGGTATYVSGSGSSALTFAYTVTAGQNTSELTVTAVNLNAATVTDGAGNTANLTGAVTKPAGTLQIDTTTPTAPSSAAGSDSHHAGPGNHHAFPDTGETGSTFHDNHTSAASGGTVWSPATSATEANIPNDASSPSTSIAPSQSLPGNHTSSHYGHYDLTDTAFREREISHSADLKVRLDSASRHLSTHYSETFREVHNHEKGIDGTILDDIFGTAPKINPIADESAARSEAHGHTPLPTTVSGVEQHHAFASPEIGSLHFNADHDAPNHSAPIVPLDEPLSQIHANENDAAPEQQSGTLRQITSAFHSALDHDAGNDSQFSESNSALARVVPDAILFKPGLGDDIPHHANSAAEQASLTHQLDLLYAELHSQFQPSLGESIAVAGNELPVVGHEPANHSHSHDLPLG